MHGERILGIHLFIIIYFWCWMLVNKILKKRLYNENVFIFIFYISNKVILLWILVPLWICTFSIFLVRLISEFE
jgi:hypothetical protein